MRSVATLERSRLKESSLLVWTVKGLLLLERFEVDRLHLSLP